MQFSVDINKLSDLSWCGVLFLLSTLEDFNKPSTLIMITPALQRINWNRFHIDSFCLEQFEVCKQNIEN